MSHLPIALGKYRIWLKRLGDKVPSVLDDAIRHAILDVNELNSKLTREFGIGEEESWDVDQDTGQLRLTFERGAPVVADIQIIGTFNGNTFKWSWANPSVNSSLKQDAMTLREWGRKNGLHLFDQEKFPAHARDGAVLSALAAKQLNAEGTFEREMGESFIYFTLRRVRRAGKTLLRVSKAPATASLHDMLTPSLGDFPELELPLPKHFHIQELADRALSELADHRFQQAKSTLELGWNLLAPHHYDMEPARWIMSAWTLAEFALGDAKAAGERARDALANGLRTAELYTVLALARAAAGDTEGAARAWLSVYLLDGRDRLADPTPLDAALSAVRRALDERVRSKQGTIEGSNEREKQAAAIVECLIEDWCEQESIRWKMERTARRRRKQAHVIEDDEMYANLAANEQWGAMLAAYFTPGRSPNCTTYGSPPSHDPQHEKVQRVVTDGAGIQVFTRSVRERGAVEQWRYALRDFEGRLLVEQLYGLWPDAEIPMFNL